MENILMFQIFGSLAASGSLVYVTSAIKKGINIHLKLQRKEKEAMEIESLPAVVRDYGKMNTSFSLVVLRRGVYNHTQDFADLLGDINHIDSNNFYNALPTLRVLIDLRKRFPKGEYMIDDNMIAVNPSEERMTTFYSLMKAAASRKSGELYAQGFARYKNDGNYDIGRGLTDAYFDIMFSKYFSPVIETDELVNPIGLVASVLESLVGQTNMEKLFFSCSLDGLVDELSNYVSREQIISLIKKLDHIYEVSKTKNVVAKNLTKKTYDEVIDILIDMLIAKYSREPGSFDDTLVFRLLESKFTYPYVTYKISKKNREKILDFSKKRTN